MNSTSTKRMLTLKRETICNLSKRDHLLESQGHSSLWTCPVESEVEETEREEEQNTEREGDSEDNDRGA